MHAASDPLEVVILEGAVLVQLDEHDQIDAACRRVVHAEAVHPDRVAGVHLPQPTCLEPGDLRHKLVGHEGFHIVEERAIERCDVFNRSEPELIDPVEGIRVRHSGGSARGVVLPQRLGGRLQLAEYFE